MKITAQQQEVLRAIAQQDLDYARLSVTLDNLEEKKALTMHTASLESVTADEAVALASKAELEGEVAKLERSIAGLEADRSSTDALLYSGRVTAEAQIQSLKDELVALRERQNSFEDDLLTVMEQLETVSETCDGLRDRASDVTSQVADLQTRYDAAAGVILVQQAETKKQRNALLAQMPPEFVALYTSMWKQYSNGPIATLEGDSCKGCNMQLPVIDVQDIQADIAAGDITYCTQCNIMLI